MHRNVYKEKKKFVATMIPVTSFHVANDVEWMHDLLGTVLGAAHPI